MLKKIFLANIVSLLLLTACESVVKPEDLSVDAGTSSDQEEDSSNPITDSVNLDIATWKTYQNSDLGIEFKYPSEWELENDYSALNTECFGTSEKGNIVDISIHLPAQGGLFLEGVNKNECANKELGSYHYATDPSEFLDYPNYNETAQLGDHTFYLAFARVHPGVHAFHAVLFEDSKAVPSLHFYYDPLTLDSGKEYVGTEEEYVKEKEVFMEVLSTVIITN